MAEEMSWGFPQYQKKGLLINARAETALERKMFRDSVLHRRCIIPAKQFYEWDQGRLGYMKTVFWNLPCIKRRHSWHEGRNMNRKVYFSHKRAV